MPLQYTGTTIRDDGNTIISFEHINIHGIRSHNNFIGLTNAIGVLEIMEVVIYNIVETQVGTTSPTFNKCIKQSTNISNRQYK